MELELVDVELPPDSNLILAQSHFIKTVEDLYAAPQGVEGPEEVRDRERFLRQIGYKLG